MNNLIQIRLLKNVMKVAAKAYWKNEVHCGADMTLECQDCPHHEVCRAEMEFNTLITAEKNAERM